MKTDLIHSICAMLLKSRPFYSGSRSKNKSDKDSNTDHSKKESSKEKFLKRTCFIGFLLPLCLLLAGGKDVQGAVVTERFLSPEGKIIFYVRGALHSQATLSGLCGSEALRAEDIQTFYAGPASENAEGRDARVRTLFLMDNSLSIAAGVRDMARAVLRKALEGRCEREFFRFCTFDRDVRVINEWSDNYQALEQTINTFTFQDQDAYLGDAMYECLSEINGKIGRGCRDYFRVILLSDGVDDNFGGGHTLSQVTKLLQAYHVPVFVLASVWPRDTSGLSALREMAEESGGAYFLLETGTDTAEIERAIQDDREILGIEITVPEECQDGSVRSVQLDLPSPQGNVRLREDIRMPQKEKAREEEVKETHSIKEEATEEKNIEEGIEEKSSIEEVIDEKATEGTLRTEAETPGEGTGESGPHAESASEAAMDSESPAAGYPEPASASGEAPGRILSLSDGFGTSNPETNAAAGFQGGELYSLAEREEGFGSWADGRLLALAAGLFAAAVFVCAGLVIWGLRRRKHPEEEKIIPPEGGEEEVFYKAKGPDDRGSGLPGRERGSSYPESPGDRGIGRNFPEGCDEGTVAWEEAAEEGLSLGEGETRQMFDKEGKEGASSGQEESERRGVLVTFTDVKDARRVFSIRFRDTVSVGKRKEDNDMVITGDPTVSRRHCFLKLREGRVYIEDQGSSNGTWVDFAAVQAGDAREIRTGQKIRMGDSLFVADIECPAGA